MSRFLSVCLLASCEIVAILAASHPSQKTSMEGARANRSKATIEGLLRDIACPIQNLEKRDSFEHEVRDGLLRAGSPIAILTKDGDLYLPISDKMPDYTQKQKLVPSWANLCE